MFENYDPNDTEWVDATKMGSKYEEQISANSDDHRFRDMSTNGHWRKGRPPIEKTVKKTFKWPFVSRRKYDEMQHKLNRLTDASNEMLAAHRDMKKRYEHLCEILGHYPSDHDPKNRENVIPFARKRT